MRNTITLTLLFFISTLVLNAQCLNTPEFPFTTDEDDYSWSGNLYPQSEVGGPVGITSVSFYLDNPTTFNGTYSDFEVYIRHTTDTQYPSFGKSWSAMGLGAGDRYYSGPLALTSGQGVYTLNLSSTFAYNGASNLEIVFACIGGDAADYTFPQEPWFRRTAAYANFPGNIGYDNFFPFSFEFKSRRQFKLLLVINNNQEIGNAQNPCGIILPAALTNFTATYDELSRSTVLAWTTAAEFNNQSFELQRSYDGREFEVIEEIAGLANSTVEQHYAFEDDALDCADGASVYYRLKQEDFDGSVAYSETKAVSCAKREREVRAYFEGSSLNLAFDTQASGKLELVNVMGQVFASEKFNDVAGFEVGVGHLPQGIYFVRLRYADGSQGVVRIRRE